MIRCDLCHGEREAGRYVLEVIHVSLALREGISGQQVDLCDHCLINVQDEMAKVIDRARERLN